jgi:hypothetical protein
MLVLAASAVLLLGALLVLRRDDEPDARTASNASTTTQAEPTPVLPLLGTPGDAPARAALGVKIDNTDNGRPRPASARPTSSTRRWWRAASPGCSPSKASVDAPTTYTTAAGQPMRLTPGQTWVEILPPATAGLT